VVALASPPADPVARDAQLVSLFLDELLAERPPWAADGLCHEYPDLSWFPTRGEPVDAQKAICRRCLVRVECAAWALDRPDIAGTWGGTNQRAREHARKLGLDVEELLDAVDAPPPDATPATWQTGPCRGCRGNLSRRDLETGDGWCWACRPIVKLDPFDEPEPGDPEMRACSACEELTPVSELDRHGGYWCTRCW
jgi:WhiB family redox-sensing transcriptional regulator